jgi:hypothetical protein
MLYEYFPQTLQFGHRNRLINYPADLFLYLTGWRVCGLRALVTD